MYFTFSYLNLVAITTPLKLILGMLDKFSLIESQRPRRLDLEMYKCLVSGTQCLGLRLVFAKFVNVSVSKLCLGLRLGLNTRPGILVYFVVKQ